MAKNYKRNEQITIPDDYNSINEGNANTTSDGVYGDFTYTEVKVGNVTKPVRRAVVSNQLGQSPYPENIHNPWEDPDKIVHPFPENTHDPDQNPDIDPRNGVAVRDEASLPSLDQKLDEAYAIYYKQPNAGEPDEKEREAMRSGDDR